MRNTTIHRGDAVYLRGLDTRREAIAEVIAAWPDSKWARIQLATSLRDGDGSVITEAGTCFSIPKYRLEVVRA